MRTMCLVYDEDFASLVNFFGDGDNIRADTIVIRARQYDSIGVLVFVQKPCYFV